MPRVGACLLVGLVLAASAGGCGRTELGVEGLDLTHAGACPYTTAEAWQAFLEGAATNKAWVETCDDDGCPASTYDAVEANVAAVFTACAGLLADNPPIAACADRQRRFTSSWLQQHDLFSYGFTADDAAYYAAALVPDVPEGMMAPPPALLSAMPNLDHIVGAARTKGWLYVVQASCLGNVRLFVVAPDPAGRFDQWTLMNLVPGTSPPLVHTRVSFLSVQRTDAAGTPLPKVRVHFRDLLVDAAGGGYSVTSDSQDNAKCYGCHPSGVRHLVAMRTPSLAAKPVLGEPGYPGDGPADFAFQRLGAMNARLTSYGTADWNGTIVPADHGPALGAEQGCTTCHNGEIRGVLTVSTSRKQLARKVVAELAMPPYDDLTQLVERQAMKDPPLTPADAATLAGAESAHRSMLASLETARAQALERWLLETPCE